MAGPESPRRIISASRRVEMAGFYPERIVDVLDRRSPPDMTHTVVVWSKHPENLLAHAHLRETLRRYDQLFFQITVTGMGGSVLEPNIPVPARVLDLLPGLVKMTGSPERIRLRFDPIVHLRMPDGSRYSNLEWFGTVLEAARAAGIRNVITSWMAVYPKVKRRLVSAGIEPVVLSEPERMEEAKRLTNGAAAYGVSLTGCCAAFLPPAGCIDGPLLSRLHPDGYQAPPAAAGGQRTGCTCTRSWDIGWYYPCPGGCLYCYGNPRRS
ncbi:DUF1848 family protein [bacterium]|nr:DUF1848 family protein [bacterium]